MFVVTLPSSAAAAPLVFAAKAADAGASYLEIRGDLSPDLSPFKSPLALIVAPRGRDLSRLLAAAEMELAYIDLETGEDNAAGRNLPRIRSFHDYESMPQPDELRRLASELRKDAAVVKIAVRPQEPRDLEVLAQLRRELADQGAVVITAMGPLAKADRLLGVVDNAWTYCALSSDSTSAEGQLLLADHLELGTSTPRLFAVLGGPEMQSLSPLIHDHLFRSRSLKARYCAMPTVDFEASFRSLERLGFEGFSVTSPFKNRALQVVDELDDTARELDCVNTLHRRGSSWHGWQKDVGGFVNAHGDLRGLGHAVVVGSGGVAPAMISALKSLQVRRISLVARNAGRRTQLADQFELAAYDFSHLADLSPDLLIWTLPVDLPHTPLPTPPAGAQAIDLRYGAPTDFQTRAKHLGYRVHDGLRLLIAQALLQFEVFTQETATADDLKGLESLFMKEKREDGK